MASEIRRMARAIVAAAGQSGGIDEVRRLANHGWPVSRPLGCDPADAEALREQIAMVAREELGEEI